MSIPKFSVDAATSDISAALADAGCVVVTGITDAALQQIHYG